MNKTKQIPVWRDSVALCSFRAAVPLTAARSALRGVLCALAALVLCASCAEDVVPAGGTNQRADIPVQLSIGLADFGTPLSDGSDAANSPAATTRTNTDIQGGTTDYYSTNGQIENMPNNTGTADLSTAAYAMIYVRGDNGQVNNKLVRVYNNAFYADDMTGFYYPAGASSYDIYVVYPLKADGTQYVSGQFNYHLLHTGQRCNPQFRFHNLGSDLLYAYHAGIPASSIARQQHITFNHMMSRIHLKFYKGKDFQQVTNVSIEVGSGYPQKSCYYTPGKAPQNFITAATNEIKPVRLQNTSETDPAITADYTDLWALLPPQTLPAGFTLFTIHADGAIYTYTLPHAVHLQSGQEYTYSYMLGDGGQGWDADMLDPLTVEMQETGALSLKNQGTAPAFFYRTKTQGGTWSAWTTVATGATATLNLATGTKVQLYANSNTVNGAGDRLNIQSTARHRVYGNITSMKAGDPGSNTNATLISNLLNNSSTVGDFQYAYLFNEDSGLTDASGLVLPATTLGLHSYDRLFFHCEALTAPPRVLPALAITESGYEGMFEGCSNLVTAPEIRAVNAGAASCRWMFQHCTSLREAPELNFATVGKYCCYSMFWGCSSMEKGPSALPAESLTEACYQNMFVSCKALKGTIALGVSDANEDQVGVNYNVDYMFGETGIASGADSKVHCKSAKVAARMNLYAGMPNIGTATDGYYGYKATPVDYQYYPLTLTMSAAGALKCRYNTGHHKYRKRALGEVWPTTWTDWNTTSVTFAAGDEVQFIGDAAPAAPCTSGWDPFLEIVSGTPTHTASGNIMSLESGMSGSSLSFGFWTDVLIDAVNAYRSLFVYNSSLADAGNLLLPATTLSESCYRDMFNQCTTMVVAPPSINVGNIPKYSCWCMFQSCAALQKAPAITATTVASEANTLSSMFNGCFNLKYLYVNIPEGQLTSTNASAMLNDAGRDNGGIGLIYCTEAVWNKLKSDCGFNYPANWTRHDP